MPKKLNFMSRASLSVLALLFPALSLAGSPRAAADPATVAPAFRADQFTDFVGLNAGPLDEAPGNAAALGIRHYRAVLKYDLTKADQPAVFSAAYDKYGVQAMMLIDPGKDGTPQNIEALLKQYKPGTIDALEGPNEVNNKFPPQDLNLKYKGQTDEAAGAAYMNDLYPAVKADPATKAISVVNYTAIFTDYHLARPCGAFDVSNMHSYQGYDIPSASLLANEASANNLLPTGARIKPFVPTECGYNVQPDVSNGTGGTGSKRAQALNIPMLFAEYFRHGIKRAYLFALDNEDGYGLEETDPAQKRPSYFAVQNLLATIKDSVWNPKTHKWIGGTLFAPKVLGFSLAGAPPTVHTLTLQKQSGEYLLLIWNEVPNFDSNAHQDIVNTPVPVTLTLQTPVLGSATILTQNAAGGYDAQAAAVGGGSLPLQVPASVMIVRLRPATHPAPASVPPPAAVRGTATPNTVHLFWRAPGNLRNAAGYFVYRNGEFLAETQALSYEDASAWVRPGLGYTYAVQCYDRAGNMSALAAAVVQTPDLRPDLICSDIVVPTPHASTPTAFQATIQNIGTGPTPVDTSCALTFFVDGQYTSYAATDGTPLAPGESRTLTADGGANGGKWTAVAGAHILHVQVDDTDRVQGETRKDNNNADRSLLVDVAGPGALLGAGDPAPEQTDLTAEGTEDWVHWGFGGKTAVNRKSAGGSRIGPVTEIGTGYLDSQPGFGMSAKWSDGTPAASVPDTHASLWLNGAGSGYQFSAPADTEARVLRVYVGTINGGAGTLTAHLSDGSAPDYVSTTFDGNLGPAFAPVPEGFTTVFTLHYHAASAGQTLSVSWTLTGDPNRFSAQARLQAATLARDTAH